MMTLNLAVATDGGRVHNLSGKERGRDVRKLFEMDRLDDLDEPIVIQIPSEIYAIAPSFVLGLLSPSVVKLRNMESFQRKYKFSGEQDLIKQIVSVLVRAAAPRGSLFA